MLRKLLITVLLSVPTLFVPAYASALPDFSASYELTRGALRIGTSTIELKHIEGSGYRYESRSWPVRWVSWFLKDKLHEISIGNIDDHGVHPDSYHYQRTGGKREREANLTFDWETNIVENDVADSRWQMEIPDGTLDKLTPTLAVMHALAQDVTDITFNIADGGKLKAYRFKVIGEDTLETPAGTFATVKITRLRNNKKRETYIWCAPELNYLPVQIYQREKDDAEYYSYLTNFSESLRVVAEK